jgi:hypothetical protein
MLIAWIGGFTVFHVAGGLIHLLLIRGDLADPAFCPGQTDCLRWARRSSPLSFRRDDYPDDSFIHYIHECSCQLWRCPAEHFKFDSQRPQTRDGVMKQL